MDRASTSQDQTGGAVPGGKDGIPFDHDKLDALMEEAGIDVVVATSKHNVQYLLGGYRFFFFDAMDAIGISRYLPVLVYPKGRPRDATYVGNPMEAYERDLGRFWLPGVQTKCWGTLDAAARAADHVEALGLAGGRIGVEMAFLPADAHLALQAALPRATLVDALFPLERLRAVKTQAELDLLRLASEKVVASMLAVMEKHGAGTTKRALVDALRSEEVGRGLSFDYCLLTVGRSHNRAPSEEAWPEGEILSLDSGGNYRGYIGDLCRMAVLGEPDQELVDLLGLVDTVQAAARRPIRAGARGGDIFPEPMAMLERSPHKAYTHFTAHGMGMVSHEAPRLTGKGSVPYPGYDENKPLEAGMVVSIETTMLHPSRGYVKLEDTVAVTQDGCVGFGDEGRGWNRGGTRRSED